MELGEVVWRRANYEDPIWKIYVLNHRYSQILDLCNYPQLKRAVSDCDVCDSAAEIWRAPASPPSLMLRDLQLRARRLPLTLLPDLNRDPEWSALLDAAMTAEYDVPGEDYWIGCRQHASWMIPVLCNGKHETDQHPVLMLEMPDDPHSGEMPDDLWFSQVFGPGNAYGATGPQWVFKLPSAHGWAVPRRKLGHFGPVWIRDWNLREFTDVEWNHLRNFHPGAFLPARVLPLVPAPPAPPVAPALPAMPSPPSSLGSNLDEDEDEDDQVVISSDDDVIMLN